MNKSRNWQF